MFATLKNRLNDAGTLSALCKEAERVARNLGAETPGSEHFVLASLCLPDGTARRALASLGATPEAFEKAINSQFADALRHAGLELAPATDQAPESIPICRSPSKLYRTTPSAQALVQRLASSAETRANRSLLTADVLLAVAEEEFSIAARALGVLGIKPEQLVHAARQEVAFYESRQA